MYVCAKIALTEYSEEVHARWHPTVKVAIKVLAER